MRKSWVPDLDLAVNPRASLLPLNTPIGVFVAVKYSHVF